MRESREAQMVQVKKVLDGRIAANRRRGRRDVQFAAKQSGGDSERIGRTGRLNMRVPNSELVYAVQKNGHGVLRDTEFWDDQKRLHPETAGARDICVPTGLKNRHGRVKERITYRNGQKITETAQGVTVEDL